MTSKSEDPVHDSDKGRSRKSKKSRKNPISDKKKVILKSNLTGGPGRAVESNLSSNITALSHYVSSFTRKYGCSSSDCKLDHREGG